MHKSTTVCRFPVGRSVIGLAALVAFGAISYCYSAPSLAAEAKIEASGEPIDFNRDIRPILSDKCFRCHGPDSASRQADLRLDREETAKAQRDEGAAVVPGKPEESLLVRHILSDDDDVRMPPPDSGKKLSAHERELLRRWVAEGAVWALPWAYIAPVRRPVPTVVDGAWPTNWVDFYLLARLEAQKMKPSADADKTTLIRRLSIDLIGLPPTPDEVRAFLADTRPNAYELLVDRLLASPHYGERLATYWFDLTRYASTVGYHGDQDHNIAPYRDYVIEALNRNLRFDQFTREQLAGDLLPSPTQEQTIATGYNRMLQTSHEGGVQPKEYLAIYAADRVRNLSAVWMGGTMGCCQCHDHKFDPYSTKDFYAMEAFFADIDEAQHFDSGSNTLPTNRAPELELLTDAEKAKIAAIEQKIKELENAMAACAHDAEPAPAAEQAPAPAAAPSGADPEKPQPEAAKAEAPPPMETEAQKKAKAKAEELKKKIEGEQKRLAQIHRRSLKTMITVAIAPREMRVLPRGNWLDDSGPVVQPAVPEFMGKLNVGERRANRLDLANWLTDAEHGVGGLTARVMANRFWYLTFGRGISPSLEDFGGQGQAPVYPELLDALALEFIDSGWDTKHMLKLLVMSHAYRQSSVTTPAIRERDPANQWFARQSRSRYSAEVVRDAALDISGLLIESGDPRSSKPYQPAGYYKHLNFPEREYKSDGNDRQWLRGVYMHWQRQFLHPMLKAFDAPSREECTCERPRSNTSLAALVVLNDPTFVEASRALAARMLTEGGASSGERLDTGYWLATSRPATLDEADTLKKLLESSRQYYKANPTEADALLAVGMKPIPAGLDHVELASWTIVARTILSLNETLTRN